MPTSKYKVQDKVAITIYEDWLFTAFWTIRNVYSNWEYELNVSIIDHSIDDTNIRYATDEEIALYFSQGNDPAHYN